MTTYDDNRDVDDAATREAQRIMAAIEERARNDHAAHLNLLAQALREKGITFGFEKIDAHTATLPNGDQTYLHAGYRLTLKPATRWSRQFTPAVACTAFADTLENILRNQANLKSYDSTSPSAGMLEMAAVAPANPKTDTPEKTPEKPDVVLTKEGIYVGPNTGKKFMEIFQGPVVRYKEDLTTTFAFKLSNRIKTGKMFENHPIRL